MARYDMNLPGGGLGQGLVGLGRILSEKRKEREIKAAQDELRAQEEQAQKAYQSGMLEFQEAYQTGDPNALADFLVKRPEFHEIVTNAAGFRDDIREQQQGDLKQYYRQVMANPENIFEITQQSVNSLAEQGRSTSPRDEILVPGMKPEDALKTVEMNYAALDPEGFKEFQKIIAGPEKEDLDIVQVYPANGEAFTAQTDKKGNYFNTVGKKIRLNETDRVVESAQLSGTAENMGLSSSEAADMDNAEINTINFNSTVDDALSMIAETPDLNTLTARGAALVNDLQTELKAMGNALGFEVDESMLDPSSHKDIFDKMGIQNNRMRSLVTNLAYARAQANNPDGRISNADFQAAVSEIGGSAADPRAFAQVLEDVRDRTNRNFKTMYRVKLGRPYQGALQQERGELTQEELSELEQLRQEFGIGN